MGAVRVAHFLFLLNYIVLSATYYYYYYYTLQVAGYPWSATYGADGWTFACG